jgi:hypothetical protein
MLPLPALLLALVPSGSAFIPKGIALVPNGLALVSGSIAIAPNGGSTVVPYKELSFTLTLPPLDPVEQKDLGEHCAGEWTGKYKNSDVHFRLYIEKNENDDFVEPEDVVEGMRDVVTGPDAERAGEDAGTRFTVSAIKSVSAAAGASPIVAFVTMKAWRKDDPNTEGLVVLASGILAANAWLVRADVWPAPAAEDATAFVAAVQKCVAYEGKPRDPKWTDDEALAFWKKIAPTGTDKKYEKPLRSEHFIVMTNSPAPAPYVKKLETKYAAIRKLLPFEDVKGRRLLPILLFRTDDDFQTFYRRVYHMETKDEVTEGSVVLDKYLATSLDNNDDREDVIDLMRLCLYNRQHAHGGGSWFHYGMRAYAATKPKERFEALHAVKNGKFTPLDTMLDEAAWDKQDKHYEKRGTTKEADFWLQSALWMEFLHDGPFPKDAFARFVETVGTIPDGERARIREAIETIFGADVDTLQKKWVEYFSKH